MRGKKNRQIGYRGIWTHNLKGIDVAIPEGEITCIVGKSGSGKTSLAFDTIAAISKAEYERLTNDNKLDSDFEVESYDEVPVAIPLKQLNFNVNPRSTIMSYFDLQKPISYICAQVTGLGMNDFNYNGDGRCPECQGLGYKLAPNPQAVIDFDKTVRDVPFKCWNNTYFDYYRQLIQLYCEDEGIDVSEKFRNLSSDNQKKLLHGKSSEKYRINYKVNSHSRVKTGHYIGVLDAIAEKTDPFLSSNYRSYCMQVRCEKCDGSRIRSEVASLPFSEDATVLDVFTGGLDRTVELLERAATENPEMSVRLVENVLGFVRLCQQLGLGHLSLTRSISTLSGGELQRLRIAQLLEGKLSGLMLVLDEPTSSLHPSEAQMVTGLIKNLRGRNTLLVVEHNERMVKISDQQIYLGPGGGENGGSLISREEYLSSQAYDLDSTFYEVRCTKTCPLSSDYVDYANSELALPIGSLVGLCGPSGSGKTVILRDIFPAQLESYRYISQKPLRGNSRTTVASYVGLLDAIRAHYSKVLGKERGNFSQHGKGACPKCGGAGVSEIGSYYDEHIYEACDACEGTGFSREVLKWTIDGLNIADALNASVDSLMTGVTDASPKARRLSLLLCSLGLGYLRLNQPIQTLSGGENQRVKLALALADKKHLIIGLDEPTKGLDDKEAARLISLLYEQVENMGRTFVVSEHNSLFLSHCSYLVELRRTGSKTRISVQGKRTDAAANDASDIGQLLN